MQNQGNNRKRQGDRRAISTNARGNPWHGKSNGRSKQYPRYVLRPFQCRLGIASSEEILKKGDPKGLPFFVSVQNPTLPMAARYIFPKKGGSFASASIKEKMLKKKIITRVSEKI